MPISGQIETIRWDGDAGGCVRLLDQTRLPSEIVELRCDELSELLDAISSLAVRGAPALGVAAAYGTVLAARADPEHAFEALTEGIPRLRASRPTAVNLFWAVERMQRFAQKLAELGVAATQLPQRLLGEARKVHDEDRELCEQMGRHGARLIEDGMSILTHCNTGRLATGGIGTALACIKTAYRSGKKLMVYAGETRPLLQGARLTLFELMEAGISCALLPDSAAASLMANREIHAVFVGADRIAANADTANKIGTFPLALAAKDAGIPFYIVAPTTTLDSSLESGAEIPIEERPEAEVLLGLGEGLVPAGARARNPAFDVTPARLITALITEKGILNSPDEKGIKALLSVSR